VTLTLDAKTGDVLAVGGVPTTGPVAAPPGPVAAAASVQRPASVTMTVQRPALVTPIAAPVESYKLLL